MGNKQELKVVITADGKEYAVAIDKATGKTKKFGDQNKKTAADVNHMAGAVKLLVGGFAALKLAQAIKGIIATNAEFQNLNASLVTVTGSVEEADKSFALIEDFATRTPYQLSEVVDSFIKLKALGLDPSMVALKSYGNTASAMGKSLNQMIEAVADASTGEFERLKEFGIKTKVEGDQVKFTFQGVTTAVGNNAKEIETYLRQMGEVQFAGGMDRQMDTIGGASSNLGDAVDNLSRAFGEYGLADAAQKSLTVLANVTTEMANGVRQVGIYEGLVRGLSELFWEMSGGMDGIISEEIEKASNQVNYFHHQYKAAVKEVKDGASIMDKMMGTTDADLKAEELKAYDKMIAAIERLNQARIRELEVSKRKRGAGSANAPALDQDNQEDKAWDKESNLTFAEIDKEMAAFDELYLRKAEALTQFNDFMTANYASDEEKLNNHFALEQQKITAAIELKVINQQAANDASYEVESAHMQALIDLENQKEQTILANQQRAAAAKMSLEMSVYNNAVGLIRAIAPESKAAALAGIVIAKMSALSANAVATGAASTLAYASQLIPGDPTSPVRAAAAASVAQGWGAANAALIVGTGLAEAAGVMKGTAPAGTGGGASGGYSPPTYDAPTFSPTAPITSEPTTIINQYIIDTVVSPGGYVRDVVFPEMANLIATEDATLIAADSRQAMELTG